MGRGRHRDDDRGISDSAGIAVLVVMTILVTVSVGISVIFIPNESEEGINANFSFQYFGDSGQLLVTHDRGDEIPAGDLLISGEFRNVTWASMIQLNESQPVSPGDAVQLSQGSRWGQRVPPNAEITIYYAPNATAAKPLDSWQGG